MDGSLLGPEDAPVKEVLATGVPLVNCELVVERPDLSRIYVLANITPLRDATGAVTGAVSILQDITELKRIQQEREGLLQDLERSNRELSQFSYAVSHDLQAPVRHVRALTQILARRENGSQEDSSHLVTLPPGESADILDKELAAAHRAGLTGVQRIARAPLKEFDSGACLRFPRQAQSHPLKYLNALVQALESKGSRIFTRTHAEGFTDGAAAEWAASASIPVDPETSPPISFAIAMTILATSATKMVRMLSPSAVLRRAVAERRWGSVAIIVSFGVRTGGQNSVQSEPSLTWTHVALETHRRFNPGRCIHDINFGELYEA